MNLWLNVDSCSNSANTIAKYTISFMATRFVGNSVLEVFGFIVEVSFCHHGILCLVADKALLCRRLKHLCRPTLALLLADTLNANPAAHDTGPSDDRIVNKCMRVDHGILKNNRVFDACSVAYFDLGTDSDVGSNFSARVDLSRGMDTAETFNHG